MKDLTNIPGWLTDAEGELLYQLARDIEGKTIVEIGSYKGKSTVYMGMGIKDSGSKKIIYAIDPHIGEVKTSKPKERPTLKEFKENIKKFKVDKYVATIVKTSEAANQGWNKKIDVLFIDGLHEYPYIKRDIQLWLPWLREGGAIAFHDAFQIPDVARAVKEMLLVDGNFRKIGYADSIVYLIKGVPMSMQDKTKYQMAKYGVILAGIVSKKRIVNGIKKFLLEKNNR